MSEKCNRGLGDFYFSVLLKWQTWDTYKKNTGEIRREVPKPVNNLHAKISAARAEAIKFELERERAHKSPISCWSNFGTLSTVAVAQSAPATVEQKSITIVNSDVTINQ